MVRAQNQPKIQVRKAHAAAIVSSANLPATLGANVDTSQKFVVHPRLASVSADSPLLLGYLRHIYSARRPLATAYPAVAAFGRLQERKTVAPATQNLGSRWSGSALVNLNELRLAGVELLDGWQPSLRGGAGGHAPVDRQRPPRRSGRKRSRSG